MNSFRSAFAARFFPELLRDLGLPSVTRLQSRWTHVSGIALHSRGSTSASGGEIPFVLIHGLVISSLYMIPLAEILAQRHSVHALDLPGFGRSESPRRILSIPELADEVTRWLDAAGIGQCHLVGNSLGCEIAAHVAVKEPARIVSLALIGPTLDPHAFAVATQTVRLLRDALHEPFRLWLNWMFDLARAGLRRAFGTTREMFRDHIEHQLPMIKSATLVMRGERDPTVPQSAVEEAVRLLPYSSLIVIQGEPHCVHYTAPTLVSEAIECFARNHSDAAGSRASATL